MFTLSLSRFVVFFILFIQLLRVNGQGQLSTAELNSAIWLIQQYGLMTPQNQSLCNYGSPAAFACITNPLTQVSNVQIIYIPTSAYTVSFLPDPNLVFSFPELTQITIMGNSPLSNINLNILSRLKNLPKLNHIKIQCPTMKTIPIDFPTGLPSLTKFDSMTSPVASAPTFFNNSNLATIYIGSNTFSDFRIDESINLASLVDLTIKVNITTTQTITTSSKSMPQLSSIMVDSISDQKLIVNIKNTPPQLIKVYLAKDLSLPTTFNSDFELKVINPTVISELTMSGNRSIIPGPLDTYSNLEVLGFPSSNVSSYPFTNFPPKIKQLNFYNAMFNSIPNLKFPDDLDIVTFENNNMVGPIDWTLFSESKLPYISLANNPNVNGVVSNDSCHVRLNILNTSITQVPDCLWCYLGPEVLITNLMSPIGLTCTPSTTQSTIYTFNGFGQIYGTLLGFGYSNTTATYSLKPIIGNNLLQLKISNPPLYYNAKPMTLKLSNTYDYQLSVSVHEVGFFMSNIETIQGVDRVEFTITFININYNLMHTILIDNVVCATTNVINQDTLVCFTSTSLSTGLYNINVKNSYYSSSTTYQYNQKYPYISSAVLNDFNSTRKVISLYGNFGFNLIGVNIRFNNSYPCYLLDLYSEVINCTVESTDIGYGLAPIHMSVDGANYTRPNAIYIPPPPTSPNNTSTTTGGNQPTPKEQCEKDTHYCYGNGECQDNGECKCYPGYSQLDNCLTKYINNTIPIEANQTSPVTKFNIDGVDFMFEMYSIQELSLDSISREIPTVSWISNITKDGDLTTANYTLLSNETNANVTATISFSSQPRQVSFGNKQINIDPNSIKVSVGIENWAFQSNIATLRVIFKTTINNEQLIGVGCDDQQNIDSFSYDSFGSTIQYLRVVKQGIQFTGRFLDYVVSDGRSTYSQTQLVSLNNTNDGNNNQSIAYIGINLPQCRQCLLDPDFTPLLIENSNVDGECSGGNNGDSKIWKIAVGASVGGVALVAIIVGSIIYLKNHTNLKYTIFKMNKL